MFLSSRDSLCKWTFGVVMAAVVLWCAASHGMNARQVRAMEQFYEKLYSDDLQDRLDAVRNTPEPAVRLSTLPGLIQALRDENEQVRSGACTRIGDIGLAAQLAVPHLVAIVERGNDDPSEELRSAAVVTLGKIGASAERAVPLLMDILRNPRDRDRDKAMEALGKIGAAAIPLLLEQLNEPDRNLRGPAVTALRRMGEAAVPPMIDALSTCSEPNCGYILAALYELGARAEPAVPFVIPYLGGDSSDSRNWSLALLREIGPASEAAIPELSLLIQREDEATRKMAAEVFAHIGGAAVPELRRILAEGDSPAGERALWALGYIQNSAPEAVAAAVPEFRAALGWEDEELSKRAAQYLRASGDAGIEVLVESLADENPGIRAHCALMLSNTEDHAAQVVPALLAALKDDSLPVRQAAAQALRGTAKNSEEAAAALVALLDDPDDTIREHAFHGLVGMKALAIPSIARALKQGDTASTVRLIRLVGALRQDGIEAGPPLLAALKGPDAAVRHAAAGALGRVIDLRYGGRRAAVFAKSAIPALIVAMADDDEGVRTSARESLNTIGVDYRDFSETIATAPTERRRMVVEQLGSFDTPVLPALISALGDSDLETRRRALRGLDAILNPESGRGNFDLSLIEWDLLTALTEAAHAKDETLRKEAQVLMASVVPGPGDLANEVVSEVNRESQDAVSRVKKMGDGARPVILAIADKLGSQDSQVQFRAASALSQFEKLPPETLPSLRTALAQGGPSIQAMCLRALKTMGPAAASAAPDIIQIWSQSDGGLFEALNPEPQTGFVNAGVMRGEMNVSDATGALWDMGPVAYEAVVAACDSENPRIRANALSFVSRKKSQIPDGRERLLAALEDGSLEVRALAATALPGYGRELDREAVAPLLGALKDQHINVRNRAAESLGKIITKDTPDPEPWIPALIDALDDEYFGVRLNGAKILGAIQPEPDEAVQMLVDTLKEPHEGKRRAAVEALTEMRSKAAAAVPALIAALDVASLANRIYLEKALGNTGYESIPALVKGFESDNPETRQSIAKILGDLGDWAEEAIPALEARAEDPDSQTRANAAEALKKIRRRVDLKSQR